MEFGKPRKIFIVDDDALASTALRDYLMQQASHQVTVFSTGEECLQHLAEKPDVIILDYYLNSTKKEAADGMEILTSIRKYYPEIHVIMFSGQERYGLAMKTIQKGAEQYVIKDQDAFGKISAILRDIR